MVVRRSVTVALAACLALSGCASSGGIGRPVETTANQAGVGTTIYDIGSRPTVPVISGETIAGSTITTAKLLGHVVVLNAWASWCEPCRDESPALARISERLKSSGVDFVGLDEQDTKDKALAFAAKAGTTYPHLFDAQGDLLASLKLLPTSGIPSSLVLDREGHVAARVIGAIHEKDFEALVSAIAAQQDFRSNSAAAAG